VICTLHLKLERLAFVRSKNAQILLDFRVKLIVRRSVTDEPADRPVYQLDGPFMRAI
jgi:hypothetical protein